MTSVRLIVFAVCLTLAGGWLWSRLEQTPTAAMDVVRERPQPRPTRQPLELEPAAAPVVRDRQQAESTPARETSRLPEVEIRVIDEEGQPCADVVVRMGPVEPKRLVPFVPGFNPGAARYEEQRDLHDLRWLVEEPATYRTSSDGRLLMDRPFDGWGLVYVGHESMGRGKLRRGLESARLVRFRKVSGVQVVELRAWRERPPDAEACLLAIVQEAGTGIRVDQAYVVAKRGGAVHDGALTRLDGSVAIGPFHDDDGWVLQAFPTDGTTPSVQGSMPVAARPGERVVIEMQPAPWLVVTTVDAATGHAVIATHVSVAAGQDFNDSALVRFLEPTEATSTILGLEDRSVTVYAQDAHGRCAMATGVVPTRDGREVELRLEPAPALLVDAWTGGGPLLMTIEQRQIRRKAEAASGGILVADVLGSTGIHEFHLPRGDYLVRFYQCCATKILARRGWAFFLREDPLDVRLVEVRADCIRGDEPWTDAPLKLFGARVR